MRKILVISLLACYLIGSTELHQILRLPLLIAHYTEHNAKKSDLTFWQFLVMHYETDVPHDTTDMKLPFKDCHHSNSFSFTAIYSEKFVLNQPVLDYHAELHAIDNASLRSSYFGEIFLPPKI